MNEYDPLLLSKPIPNFRYDIGNLFKLADWVIEKINTPEFHKFSSTIMKIKNQHKNFMELYERAKIKEGEVKDKALIKALQLFYRPSFEHGDAERLFQRLVNRANTSKSMRKNNAVSKTKCEEE